MKITGAFSHHGEYYSIEPVACQGISLESMGKYATPSASQIACVLRIATRRPISCQTPRLFLSTCPLKSGSLTISDGASPGYISSRSCLCSTFPLLRQHRTIASSSLSRLFAPLPQFRKWEIHTVFHHFRNFELGQKFWLSLLAELCGAALTLSECTSLSCSAIFQCGLGKGVGS